MDSGQLAAVIALVAGGFIATNLDNLLLLVVLQASTHRRLPVLAGFITSSVIVLLVALIGFVMGSLLDPALLGYAGVVPVGLGLYALWNRSEATTAVSIATPAPTTQAAVPLFFSSVVLMLSNSSDSLAIFLPLLAEIRGQWLPLACVTWLALVLLWSGIAYKIGENQALVRLIEQRGSRWVPWIMIAIGGYILFDTATDSL